MRKIYRISTYRDWGGCDGKIGRKFHTFCKCIDCKIILHFSERITSSCPCKWLVRRHWTSHHRNWFNEINFIFFGVNNCDFNRILQKTNMFNMEITSSFNAFINFLSYCSCLSGGYSSELYLMPWKFISQCWWRLICWFDLVSDETQARSARFHVFAAGVHPRVMADLLLTYRPNLICHSIALSSRPPRDTLSRCMRQGCQACQAWTRCPRVVAPLFTYTPNLIWGQTSLIEFA